MLCPQCRRMVGKDGYCPQGHLARPELYEQPKAPPAPPPASDVPSPEPYAPVATAPPEVDFYTPPGLGPSNPPSARAVTVPASPATASPAGLVPTAPPGVPPETPGAVPARRGKKVTALLVALVVMLGVVAGFTLLGGSAGAANLKIVFTPGEMHTYALEMTVRGKSGNLSGGISVDSAIDAVLTQRTGAVDKDGSAKITYSISDLHFSQGGRRITPPAGTGGSFSVRMKPNGSVTGLDDSDPFGLEDVNPAATLVGPEKAGPLLPGSQVKPGQSWTIEVTESDPDLGSVTVKAVNTLVERGTIGGNETVVIRSVATVPLNLRLGRDQLVKQAKNSGGDGSNIPGDAAIQLVGNMRLNLTQTLFSANGLLQSALGDGAMTGTMTIEGIPQLGNLSVVFDLDFNITMTKTSTGTAA